MGVLGGREMGILSCGAMSCQVLFRVKCVQMTDLHVLILRDCRDFLMIICFVLVIHGSFLSFTF